jgi:hypothetical protein
MSLLLLFNGRLGPPAPPIIIQTYPMGDHGTVAVVSQGGRVGIVETDGAVAVTCWGAEAIIVESEGSASAAASGIRTGIE